jgi:uncharacterized protein (TIGR03435 family)
MLRSLVIGVLAVSAFGQIPMSGSSESSTVTPRFQVATIKPSRLEESRSMQIRGNRFATTDTSVVDLLKYAYGLHEQEIVGGPKWLKTEKFDLVGDPETQTRPSSDDFKKMVQNLLTDRFDLTAHHETRDLSVFEIVPAKSGPKLNKSTRPPNGIPGVSYLPGQLSVANATIADLATFLQRFVTDRPVFDRTGITGEYDLTLRWTPDELQTEGSRQSDDNNNSLPGLYTAIQEQLGLKLQEEKRPAQVFVVDHVDMSSEN